MVHAGSSPVFPVLHSEWRLQRSRPVPAEGYGEKRQLHSSHDQTLAQAFAACGIQDVSGRGRNIGVKLWLKKARTGFSGIPKGEFHA